MSADVEQQVAGRRGRAVPRAGKLRERMQPRRTPPAEQSIPNRTADTDDTGQLSLGDPETDRPPEPADIRQQIANFVLRPRIDGHGEEDRGLRDRGEDGLWLSCLCHSSLPRELDCDSPGVSELFPAARSRVQSGRLIMPVKPTPFAYRASSW
jgi:hypothetical protein